MQDYKFKISLFHQLDLVLNDCNDCLSYLMQWQSTVVIDNGALVFRTVNLLKVEPGSVSEIRPTSHGGNQIIGVKVEEDPLPIEFPGINCEPEVSFMYVCPLLGTFHRHRESFFFLFLSVCQFVHLKHLHSTE
jgi:hypothetical protein